MAADPALDTTLASAATRARCIELHSLFTLNCNRERGKTVLVLFLFLADHSRASATLFHSSHDKRKCSRYRLCCMCAEALCRSFSCTKRSHAQPMHSLCTKWGH